MGSDCGHCVSQTPWPGQQPGSGEETPGAGQQGGVTALRVPGGGGGLGLFAALTQGQRWLLAVTRLWGSSPTPFSSSCPSYSLVTETHWILQKHF